MRGPARHLSVQPLPIVHRQRLFEGGIPCIDVPGYTSHPAGAGRPAVMSMGVMGEDELRPNAPCVENADLDSTRDEVEARRRLVESFDREVLWMRGWLLSVAVNDAPSCPPRGSGQPVRGRETTDATWARGGGGTSTRTRWCWTAGGLGGDVGGGRSRRGQPLRGMGRRTWRVRRRHRGGKGVLGSTLAVGGRLSVRVGRRGSHGCRRHLGDCGAISQGRLIICRTNDNDQLRAQDAAMRANVPAVRVSAR